MAVGKSINGDGQHIDGFREELGQRARQGHDAFFTFFNDGLDWQESYINGAWDFSVHIAAPLTGHIGSPRSLSVLEVGYGGGRLLAAAARHFGQVIGVDVHDETDLVLTKLEGLGIDNATLHSTDGRSYPLADTSIDGAYSFIVFQHMQRVDILRDNLREIYRVLKPGGFALVYFGRIRRQSAYRSSRFLALLDMAIERMGLCRDVEELEARVNQINLRLSSSTARRLCRDIGFTIKGSGLSRRRPPQEGSCYGGQSYLLLEKP